MNTILLSAFLATAQPAPPPTPSAAVSEIREPTERRFRANAAKDRAFYETLLAEDPVIGAAILAAGLSALAASPTPGVAAHGGETVAVPSGGGRALRGLLWLPAGNGPFPAVLFCHGSGTSFPPERTALGPLFAKHGYAFLFLFRRGSGLSAGAGVSSGELMERELKRNGLDARNRLQLQLLETDELEAERAGLDFLRGRSGVDASRIAVVGHSFGGSLALLLAEGEPGLRAVVDFAGAAGSWEARRPPCANVCSPRRPGARRRCSSSTRRTTTRSLRRRPSPPRWSSAGGPTRADLSAARNDRGGRDTTSSTTGVSVWESDVFAFLDGVAPLAGRTIGTRGDLDLPAPARGRRRRVRLRRARRPVRARRRGMRTTPLLARRHRCLVRGCGAPPSPSPAGVPPPCGPGSPRSARRAGPRIARPAPSSSRSRTPGSAAGASRSPSRWRAGRFPPRARRT